MFVLLSTVVASSSSPQLTRRTLACARRNPSFRSYKWSTKPTFHSLCFVYPDATRTQQRLQLSTLHRQDDFSFHRGITTPTALKAAAAASPRQPSPSRPGAGGGWDNNSKNKKNGVGGGAKSNTPLVRRENFLSIDDFNQRMERRSFPIPSSSYYGDDDDDRMPSPLYDPSQDTLAPDDDKTLSTSSTSTASRAAQDFIASLPKAATTKKAPATPTAAAPPPMVNLGKDKAVAPGSIPSTSAASAAAVADSSNTKKVVRSPFVAFDDDDDDDDDFNNNNKEPALTPPPTAMKVDPGKTSASNGPKPPMSVSALDSSLKTKKERQSPHEIELDFSHEEDEEEMDESSTSELIPGEAPLPKVRAPQKPSTVTAFNISSSSSREDLLKPLPPNLVHAAQLSADNPRNTNANSMKYWTRAAQTGGESTLESELERVKDQLEKVEQSIYQQNGGVSFNINSPQQVASILYGTAWIGSDRSTNKDKLEGMASGGNRMASLILEYRSVKQQYTKLQRKIDTIQKGLQVKSASATAPGKSRSSKSATSAATTTTTDPVKANNENDEMPQNSDSTNEDEKDVVSAAMTTNRTDPLLLVDASAYIFRAYYSMPPMHRSDGMPVGAVMGFCNMLNRLILNRLLAGEQPRLVLVFDAVGKNFRHALYPDYKGHRAEAPMDLLPQFALVRQAAAAYGIPQLEADRFEADDVIATLATMAMAEGMDTHILSGDKDLMQLITMNDEDSDGPYVHMVDPMTMTRVTSQQVMEKWGVRPDQLGDVLALAGDASDNVPGVPGIGPKIAAQLINEFGTLDQVLENNCESIQSAKRREKLQTFTDQARLSRALVNLDRNVPMDILTFPDSVTTVTELRMEPINVDRLLSFYDSMGFRDLKGRLQKRLGQQPAKKWPFPKRPKTVIPKPEDYADVPF